MRCGCWFLAVVHNLEKNGNQRRLELSENFNHSVRPKLACKGHFSTITTSKNPVMRISKLYKHLGLKSKSELLFDYRRIKPWVAIHFSTVELYLQTVYSI